MNESKQIMCVFLIHMYKIRLKNSEVERNRLRKKCFI